MQKALLTAFHSTAARVSVREVFCRSFELRARAVCAGTLREVGSSVLIRRHNTQQHDGRTRSSRMGAQLERLDSSQWSLRLGSARFLRLKTRLGSIETSRAGVSGSARLVSAAAEVRLGSARNQMRHSGSAQCCPSHCCACIRSSSLLSWPRSLVPHARRRWRFAGSIRI